MLSVLRVRNFAIIDEIEVDLGPGFNAVTGETGAGKSILVGALELVLGARGDADLVRTGAASAEVEALFEDPGDASRALVLRRTLPVTGRSRAYVDGALATMAQLAERAAGLVDISSQHEHHVLGNPASHLEFLDAFAGLSAARAGVARAHEALLEAEAAVTVAELVARDRDEREDLLRYQLCEIEALGLAEGELEELEARRERLRHAGALLDAAAGAEAALYSDDGALCDRLGRIAAELTGAARHDPALAAVADTVEAARAGLEEAARDLGRYARSLDAEPGRLEEVEERLYEARRLLRKYGGTWERLDAHRRRAAAELEGLGDVEGRLAALERVRDEILGAVARAAEDLSARRRAAAGALSDAVSEELRTLGMGEARVEVAVDPARLTATGKDRVEFLIAPNPGESPRPLGRIASGGELSRSLLAVKRVLAEAGPAGLYVFDEVDTGVGGAVAEVIGRKLRDVSRHRQVLCITHLPQIAAYADAHFQVRKERVAERTRSVVRRLEEPERLEELARMLGGVEVTDATRAAAAEMWGAARAYASARERVASAS